MPQPATLHRRTQPAQALLTRAWPCDAQLRRRRSVLFAFTFSPPSSRA